MILQWGISSPSPYKLTRISFKIPFPHKCFYVNATPNLGNSRYYGTYIDTSIITYPYNYTNEFVDVIQCDIGESDSFSFTEKSHDDHVFSCFWMAIGY